MLSGSRPSAGNEGRGMNTKRKALKGLLILVCVLLASMYFAQTVQTITTAKVQKVSATRGKLEDRIDVKGEVRFSNSEPFTLDDARSMKLTVNQVLAQRGGLIMSGEPLFTAILPDYESKMEQLRADYKEKVRARAQKVADNIRMMQTSEQNEYHNAMLKATDEYWDKLFKARAAALAAGHELPDDIGQWDIPGAEDIGNSAPQADGTEETEDDKLANTMRAAMREAHEAALARDEATERLKRLYVDRKTVYEPVFEYIKDIDKKSEELYRLIDDMTALERQKLALEAVRAPREGWLTEFDLKQGDTYDGSKPAYSLSAPGEQPVMRCDITDVPKVKAISKGMKASVEGSERELSVSDVLVMADGKKYALIDLDETTVAELGGLSRLMRQPLNVKIIYKAQRTTTLIPLSALNEGQGENAYFVYVISQNYGGLLSGSTMTVEEMKVTLIDKSARMAAIEEDIAHREIADRADRPLSNGQAVMEYVD